MKRSTVPALLSCLLLFTAATAGAAVYIVPTDREMIRQADAIVIATVGSGYGEFAKNGDIVTRTELRLERVLKGPLTANETIETRDLGGVVGSRAMGISDGVTYTPGERVLLFLTKDGASWTTYELALGKFALVKGVDGDELAVRASEIFGWDARGNQHVEKVRLAAEFVEAIEQSVGNPKRDVADYFTNERPRRAEQPRTRMQTNGITAMATQYPPSAYTKGPFRWNRFDLGQTISFYVNGAQPGYDSTGAAQRALAGWTNDPTSTINYRYGGTTASGFVEDGVNAIVFNSPTGVPAGAIGYSRWYADGTHPYKGETFYSISEGDVVMAQNFTFSQKVLDEAVMHELGHTLGFRHSDEGTPSSLNAVMAATVTGNYGANPGPWDREAANHVYGDSTVFEGSIPPPTTCTAPAITGQPTSRTITAGNSTTLTVTATGTAPLTYQWYVGTSGSTTNPISGATSSSLTVSPAASTNYWVRVTNSCGTVNSATATVTVNAAAPPPPPVRIRGDFDGNGHADVLWRNSATGEVRIWLMNMWNPISAVALPTVADLNFQIGGVGDFNRDGQMDIVWRNYATGQNLVWIMSNTTVASTLNLPAVTDLSWRIESVNDFNRDGYADLMWRNYTSGLNTVWLMSGGTNVSGANFTTVTDLSWHIAGTGDTTGDGVPDIVWRNTRTGENVIWFMTGPTSTTFVASTALATIVDQNWVIGAVASYDGNLISDLLWRNQANGQTAAWLMGGGEVGNTVYLPTEMDLNWRIVSPR
jgi:hypothetical protein